MSTLQGYTTASSGLIGHEIGTEQTKAIVNFCINGSLAIEVPTKCPRKKMVPPTKSGSKRKRASRALLPPSSSGFQFITTTKPEEFLDKQVLRQVRSHVMHEHVRQQGRSESAPVGDSTEKEMQERSVKNMPLPTRSKSSSATLQNPTSKKPKGREPAMPSSKSATTNVAFGTDVPDFSQGQHDFPLAFGGVDNASDSYPEALGSYCEEVELDRASLSPSLPPPAGHEMADFPLLPGNKADQDTLRRFCIDFFRTTTWEGCYRSSSNVLLVNLLVAASQLDLARGATEESFLTTTIRARAIALINYELNDEVKRFDNCTLLHIAQLLRSETIAGDEEVVNVHRKGIERLILLRGGIGALGFQHYDGTHANPLRYGLWLPSVMLQVAIVTEQPPHSMFLDCWSAFDVALLPHSISDNPIHVSTGHGFTPLEKSKRCNPLTYRICFDMVDLTNLALGLEGTDSGSLESRQFDGIASAIIARLHFYSLAEMEGHPASGDYIYESARLTALIYAHALASRIPISESALRLSVDHERPVTVQLKRALERSGLLSEDVWDDGMGGVMTWCALVGAAAGRCSRRMEFENEHAKREAEMARAWLVGMAMRCAFGYMRTWKHPAPILGALRRLVRVQMILCNPDADAGWDDGDTL